MGHVLQAGDRSRPGRPRSGAARPATVPALTVNKVCLSGLNAIATAAQYVELGQAGLLVAGGMESMSDAPYLVPKARFGARMGDAELVDAMVHDGPGTPSTTPTWAGCPTRSTSASGSTGRPRTRRPASRTAAEATKNGLLAEEITPVIVHQRKDHVTVDQDEGIRPGTTAEAWGGSGRRSPDGTITAGNASQISDGAAAVVVTSGAAAAEGLRCSPRSWPTGPWPGPTPACTPSRRGPSPTPAGGPGSPPRPGPGRDQRGLRRGGAALDPRAGAGRGHRQRQRRRRRPRPPDRGQRRPGRAHPGHGAAPPRRGLGAAALCGGGGQGDALLVRVEA